MFKKGQVILSARTNRIFIVDIRPFASLIANGRVRSNPLRIGHSQWVLIGNNYWRKGV